MQLSDTVCTYIKKTRKNESSFASKLLLQLKNTSYKQSITQNTIPHAHSEMFVTDSYDLPITFLLLHWIPMFS